MKMDEQTPQTPEPVEPAAPHAPEQITKIADLQRMNMDQLNHCGARDGPQTPRVAHQVADGF